MPGSGVTTASNVICIGANVAGSDVADSCYIGNIFGDTSSGGTAVFVNTNGRLGTTTSSRRFKDEIKPMDKASEVILALKPVSFRFIKKRSIPRASRSLLGGRGSRESRIPTWSFAMQRAGRYAVRYEQVNAMLLNEFLKEHKKVEELEVTIAQQQKSFESRLAVQDRQDRNSHSWA